MKKNRLSIYLIAGLMLLGGCAKESFDIPVTREPEAGTIDFKARSFIADIYSDDTRTSIGTDNKIYWTEDDRVSVFCSTTDNLQYTFTGETGSRTGTLHKIASEAGTTGKALDRNYAVYPYNAANSISEDGVMTVTLPSTQYYSQNTFGQEANIMAAVSSNSTDYNLSFKNAGGYLVVKLYGKATVRSLVLTSTDGEKLSGEGRITFNEGIPSLTMLPGASSSITLDCGNGVKLGTSADDATEFWFVLPPVTFSQGFSLQVICDEGSFSKQKNTSGTIHRNGIVTISPFMVSTDAGQYIGLLKEPEIWNTDKILDMAESFSDAVKDYKGILKKAVKLLGGIIETGEIKLSRIIYTTTDPKGNIVEASGLVAFPTSIPSISLIDWSNTYDKIVSVQHATCGIDESPSMIDIPKEIIPVLKKGNDVVVLADYLGYGVSRTGDLQHPYMHNTVTGTTCADLIQAAQEFVKEEGLDCASNYKIELIGYSQGGAATISTLLELEDRKEYDGHIGDVYAGGGPHDINVFLKKFLDEKEYIKSGFLAYLIRGMVYGENLDVDFHNLFAEEVFEGPKPAFDMFSTDQSVSSWHSVLGTDLTKILHPDFFAPDFNGNTDIIKFVNALDKNSCVNFVPKNKSNIKLYHSPNDNTVLYQCSVEAAKVWGIQESSIHKLEKEDHVDAAIEFYIKYISETLWGLAKGLI